MKDGSLLRSHDRLHAAMDKLNAISFMGDRPAGWPNRRAEQVLPQGIGRRLDEAADCMFVERETAAALAEEAVDLARAAEPDVLARTLCQAAAVLRLARRPDRAFILCLEAQPLLERLDDRWRASGVILERGLCYLAVGEHDRALELLTQAAERFEKLDDGVQAGRCWNAMAKAHLLGADLRRAIACAVRSQGTLDMAREHALLGHQFRAVEAYLRLLLGHQLAENGGPRLAQLEYARAVRALPALDDIELDRGDPGSALVLDTTIAVHLAAGNAIEAQAAMKMLARWARRRASPVEKGLAWLRLSDFRIDQGLKGPAIACARRAATHLENVPLEPNRVAAQLQLARLLEEVGDFAGAYAAHCEASRIDARLQGEAVAMRAELLMLDMQAEQELRKTEQTLAYAQRQSNVGHMVASINHELNQPMASLKMLTETTIELLDRGEQVQALANIELLQRLGARLVDLASQLAAFPARSAAEPQRVCVRSAIDDACAMLRSRLARSDCELLLDVDDLAVRADEGQLVRVIANLLYNALDAMESRPTRRIRVTTTVDAGHAAIHVADCGPGLSESVRERLFQPFFSTKPAGQGLGLGLALSRDVLREMGGDLVAANGPDGGAVFSICLARCDG